MLGGELGGATELLLEPLRRGLADTAMAAAVDAVEVVPARSANAPPPSAAWPSPSASTP